MSNDINEATAKKKLNAKELAASKRQKKKLLKSFKEFIDDLEAEKVIVHAVFEKN
jgi:hypothetical protein